MNKEEKEEREADIYIDILSTGDTVDAAFCAVEAFAGKNWLKDGNFEDFELEKSRESEFLRKSFFEEQFPTEENQMNAVMRYWERYNSQVNNG